MRVMEFSEMAEQVSSDNRLNVDLPCSLAELEFRVDPDETCNQFKAVVPGEGPLVMEDWAASQLARRLKIPYEFLSSRCSPGLAQQIIDHFMSLQAPRAVLLRLRRTDDGMRVRAMLPASWSCFDNVDFLELVDGVVDEYGMKVQRYQIGKVAFYCRLLFPENVDAGSPGEPDPHNFGVFFRNSEVGFGVPEAQFTMVRQICSNGLMGMTGESIMRLHQSSLNSLRKGRLVGRFRNGLRKNLSQCGSIVDTIRSARRKKLGVEDVAAQLSQIHNQYGLSKRNLDIVREAFIQESNGVRTRETTAFTLASAFNRAAQHLPGEESIKYETAAWRFMSRNGQN